MVRMRVWPVLLLAVVLGGAVRPAPAADGAGERLERLEKELGRMEAAARENERRQKILAEEVRKLRESLILPETPALKGQYGMGPAASKVYGKEKGFSIGGYGQGWYTGLVSDKGAARDAADLQRFVLYNGYKFSDKLVLNSEIEYEHATTGAGGSVSVEFAQLDYLRSPGLNFRAGLLLMPMGFVNEVHEPLFYHGNERPEVERQILPSTWRENGLGLFGELEPGWQYRAYLVNSSRGSRFTSGGLRGGRQNGASAFAEDYSLVLRTDREVAAGLTLGGSFYSGDQGQSESLKTSAAGAAAAPDIHTRIWEAHAQYRRGGLELRALAARANVDDADILSLARAVAKEGPVGSRLSGAYLEVAYDLMPWLDAKSEQSLTLFARRESFDTLDRLPLGFADDRSRDVRLTTIGFDYKIDPQVVLKLDYRNFTLGQGTRPDEVNLGVGWIF